MKRLPPPTLPKPLAPEDAGEEARAQSLETVGAHADPVWMQHALGIAHDLSLTQAAFTADDIWEKLDDLDVETHDNRAMGAVMTEAARQGWVHRTDNTVLSRRPINHRRPVRVWTSLVYEPSELLPTSPIEDGGSSNPDTQVTAIGEVGDLIGDPLLTSATEVDELPPGDDAWSSGSEQALEKAAMQIAALRAVSGQRRLRYYLMACPDHGYWLLSTGPKGIEGKSTWMGVCAACRRAESDDVVREISVPNYPQAPLVSAVERVEVKALMAEAEAGAPDDPEAHEETEAGTETQVPEAADPGEPGFFSATPSEAQIIPLPPPRRRGR